MSGEDRRDSGRNQAVSVKKRKRPVLFGGGNGGTAGVSFLEKAVHERVGRAEPVTVLQVVGSKIVKRLVRLRRRPVTDSIE